MKYICFGETRSRLQVCKTLRYIVSLKMATLSKHAQCINTNVNLLVPLLCTFEKRTDRGSQKSFITAFTRSHHLFPSLARLIQSKHSHPLLLRFVLMQGFIQHKLLGILWHRLAYRPIQEPSVDRTVCRKGGGGAMQLNFKNRAS
jgi:hypothetical protein